MALAIILPQKSWAQEPYAALSDNNTVLTFYYDDHKAERNGMDVGPFSDGEAKPWNGMSRDIQNVVFDASFSDCTTVTSTSYWFSGCSSLSSLDFSNFNTSNVTLMKSMFDGCNRLTSINLSNLNTANVTDMNQMFDGCYSLTTLDLSNFNTAKVTDMRAMVRSCSGLTTIYVGDGWSTASVREGTEMFEDCINLVGGAGTHYDADHTDYTYAHIDGGTANPGYFTRSGDEPWVDPTGPEPYAVLNDNNTVLTFYYDEKKAERNGMSVGPFTNTGSREWEDNVTTISSVEFDPSFADCTSITSTARWFDGCSNLTSVSGISNLYTANVTSMRRMFRDCSSLTSVDLSHFNTENVTNMEYMFDGCSSLTILDVSGFNTENVTNMGSMFASCSNLTTLDVTGFNTTNVTDISRMFYSCSGLTTLDLSNFNTANAKEDLRHLFMNCSSLKTIYAGNGWTTDATTKGDEMFMNCTSLEGGAGTKYDANHTDHTYAHIDGGENDQATLQVRTPLRL